MINGIALSDAEWKIVNGILRRIVPTHQVWVFGSRATHQHKPFSDLDLMLTGDHVIDLHTRAALSDAFTESDLPFKVDWVDGLTISPEFRQIIERDRIPFSPQEK